MEVYLLLFRVAFLPMHISGIRYPRNLHQQLPAWLQELQFLRGMVLRAAKRVSDLREEDEDEAMGLFVEFESVFGFDKVDSGKTVTDFAKMCGYRVDNVDGQVGMQ